VENIWPNKIEYTIGTPSKAIIFGTSIQVNFRLVSLLKGLRIGLCSTEVLETHEFAIEQDGSSPERKRKDTRSIAMDQYTVDAEADPDILDEQAEGYQFSRYLELPKTLKSCVQDAEIHGIKIRHKLKFNVALHNPDGHISELRATLPISLFISPSIAINENNDLVDQTPVASRLALENDVTNSAPPLYGQHQFDQYYSEMDHTGYRTPGNFSTPGTPFGSLSRNISAENLSSLIGQGGRESTFELSPAYNQQVNGDVSPAALQHRLQNIRVCGSGLAHSPLAIEDHYSDYSVGGNNSIRHPSNAPGDYFDPETGGTSLPHSQQMSPGPSPGPPGDSARNSLPNGHLSRNGSTDLSRPNSGEDHGTNTPIPHYHEIEDLARIPSYSTAVRTPARRTYSGTDLPSYVAAVGSSHGQSSPAQPPIAYLRGVRH
jgi:arrestin-related trafficking adapter 4/5/7